VVYDDLTKQAATYRQISLLLRRPPGREAYPGDVFYLHSRLLERACKLAERYVIVPRSTPEDVADVQGVNEKAYEGPLGLKNARADLARMQGASTLKVHRLGKSGGSMTALPICETQEGEVSAYIPTNLISITDGQIYLEPSLFFAGVRPAINVGISVSRVGYKAAYPAMKEVAKSLRLDLAAYRELESFAQMGMELDAATHRQLDRGMRMVRLLTQPQYQPMPMTDQIIAVFTGTYGMLDDLNVEEVNDFERGLLAYIKDSHRDLYRELEADKSLTKEREKRLKFLVDEYKTTAYDEVRKSRRQKARPEGKQERPSA